MPRSLAQVLPFLHAGVRFTDRSSGHPVISELQESTYNDVCPTGPPDLVLEAKSSSLSRRDALQDRDSPCKGFCRRDEGIRWARPWKGSCQ